MAGDLLARLREQAEFHSDGHGPLHKEAADEIERTHKLAEQIKARATVSKPDDEKELRRQMAHIVSLADAICEVR
jgi:hypothetical protein